MNKSFYKWIIVALTLATGFISFFYTQWLVTELSARERKQINFFAKALDQVYNTNADSEVNLLLLETLESNEDIPLIAIDEQGQPVVSRNIEFREEATAEEKEDYLRERVEEMKGRYSPIKLEAFGQTQLIYYDDSSMLKRLRLFSLLQVPILLIFGVVAFVVFRSSKRAEENQLWVGLAKETAHQLGTPISSLLAWIEYLRASEEYEGDTTDEMEKDVERLVMVTERFSSIGSKPVKSKTDLLALINKTVAYLQKRFPSKVAITVSSTTGNAAVLANVNAPLIEWVIENLCKNAADAMPGKGDIVIRLNNNKDQNKAVHITVTDNGKGIPKNKHKAIFTAGYTTKKRGWGLGLTLVKRIMEFYHDGKVSVMHSEQGKGTTFLLKLPKQ